MDKVSWKMFEDWASKKAVRFGMDEKWVEFTLWIVSKRVEKENKTLLKNILVRIKKLQRCKI